MPQERRSANAKKVAAHRARLRAQGLRSVQIWLPDTRAKSFGKQARAQSVAMAKADRKDRGLSAFLDSAWTDLAED